MDFGPKKLSPAHFVIAFGSDSLEKRCNYWIGALLQPFYGQKARTDSAVIVKKPDW